MRGGKQYISFPATIKKSIKTDWPMEQTASEKTFYRIVLANSSLLPVMNVLEQILLATIDRYQAEWDCCSRYMECSDAKKCIHPDSAFSVACGYKRKLEAGKIFYGTNRNID